MQNDFSEAKRFLETRLNFEQQRSWTLDEFEERLRTLKTFLQYCGSPDRSYKIIHIAGTKGKGSVCAYFENILHAAGYNTGCFTSPHLLSFLERWRTNCTICSEDDFAAGMLYLKEQLEKASAEIKTTPLLPDYFTYFEAGVLFAFLHFAAKKVDAVILETGLGGRLDATNICEPCLTVITGIGLEHTEQLGSTLAAIAREKAGIIKPAVDVVSGILDEEPQNLTRNIAKERCVDFYQLGEAFEVIPQEDNNTFTFRTLENSSAVIENLRPAMFGLHQQRNAALAVEGMHILRQRGIFNITDDNIRSGVAAASLPARIEIVEQQGKPPLVFDGAHTKDSVHVLLETLEEKFPEKSITAIFGVSSGKDIGGIFDELLPKVSRLIFTQHSSSTRRIIPQELYEFVQRNKAEHLPKCSVIPDCKAALESAVKNAAQDDLLCITGSLFLAAELSEEYQRR